MIWDLPTKGTMTGFRSEHVVRMNLAVFLSQPARGRRVRMTTAVRTSRSLLWSTAHHLVPSLPGASWHLKRKVGDCICTIEILLIGCSAQASLTTKLKKDLIFPRVSLSVSVHHATHDGPGDLAGLKIKRTNSLTHTHTHTYTFSLSRPHIGGGWGHVCNHF